MKVAFFGSSNFAVPALEALSGSGAGHEIACVYTRRPMPAARGKKTRPTPVHERAEALGLPMRHPDTLKDPDEIGALRALEADVAVVVAYGLILPQEALDVPRFGCLDIHASLLPRWRGAAPIQRAIMAGDEATGVCIMQMEAGLDTGPVLLMESTAIWPEETAGDVHDRLAKVGAKIVLETLAHLDDLPPVPQFEEGATYARKIEKSEARVDWSRSAREVACRIRGLSPFPGAWTELDGTRLKLLRARVAPELGAIGDSPPGTVISAGAGDAIAIACGNGAVEITTLQKSGKKPQDAAAFVAGSRLSCGDQLV